MARRICVLTGTRADYGLLYWLIKGLRDDPRAELDLVVTGMHLSPEFGETYKVIEADGFPIAAKVDMLLSGDSPTAIAKSMGLATIGFADAFERLRPDLVVILGDRFEVLAAAQAALVARIPMAHIHGGEVTEGVIDEAIRHSLSKMAHLHFTAAEAYRARVVQLGENPERVFTVGALGLDNFKGLSLLDREALAESLGLDLDGRVFSVTYHPETLSHRDPRLAMEEVLAALDAFPEASVVLTKANADTNGRVINQLVDDYVARHPGRAMGAVSLGQLRYLSLLTQADVVIGNSSSGLLEAPTARTPTVNIGDRQRGRLRAPSVIDCAEGRESIIEAIERALSPEVQAIAARGESPFGDGGASARIVEYLLSVDLEGILKKRFHDIVPGGLKGISP